MENFLMGVVMEFFGRFYLDNEKDIIVNLYQSKEVEDVIFYVLETPNHRTGNLITNLAKICNVETVMNEKEMKIITGNIPVSINGDNEEVYIFRLGGIKIANIYPNGKIEIKAKIPAITKTLMSQTKDYRLPVYKTIVKSYIYKKSKFRTDLHTHMNANLQPDILIALGIKHQIRYPLYYIKKAQVILSPSQEKEIMKQRAEVEKQFENSELEGKYLTRKIDDNTFINFADLILNNLENAEENIRRIRSTNLTILKDGQAVFTDLEKTYLYRYVFLKGKISEEKIEITPEKVDSIPETDVKNILKQMLEDGKKGSKYEHNTIRQDKLLWVAREYQKQGIWYVEIADTDLAKIGEAGTQVLEQIHEVVPKIEEDTGVALRFLVGLRRIPLIIVKDQVTDANYLRDNLITLKAMAKSPYVVGSDFIGEELNDITDLKWAIKEIVEYVKTEDPDFTIRIHAGENDSLKDNVGKSIDCVISCLKEGDKIPHIRLGHGLYTPSLDSEEGKELIKKIRETGTVLEFQLTSNVRLNNLNVLENHPLKQYLKEGVKCVQGTDGYGFYGTDTVEEQLALQNLVGLTEEDFKKMRDVEEEILEDRRNYFEAQIESFGKLTKKRGIKETILKLEQKYKKDYKEEWEISNVPNKVLAALALKEKVIDLPEDKMPIVIAGGSFNSQDRETILGEQGEKLLRELLQRLDPAKVFFVVGHKMQGYEKAILDISRELNKKFEVDAIIPNMISEEIKEGLLKNQIDGVCVSIEPEERGIYKSFNYEIFKRRPSIVIAFDGNSPVSNLIQNAKNGKGKAKIYVNEESSSLSEKAKLLEGYVTLFKESEGIVDRILQESPELGA